jgi:SAM-dependent methyltransferase
MLSGPNVYETLALEYYDSVRHPTCANFRDCSKLLMRTWLPQLAHDGHICEVGCGMSLAAELLSEDARDLHKLSLTDSSPSMLMYSAKWQPAGAKLLLSDAADLPFSENSIHACIASLGDPYNHSEFWNEMARIVEPFGHILFTTPAFEWASLYRNDDQDHSAQDVAEFALSSGMTILAPSMIYSLRNQTSLIERTGKLQVEGTLTVTYSQIPSTSISSKLLVAKADNLPVVTGYLICKNQ